MAEFTLMEQQLMAKELTDQQKLLFSTQLESVKKDRNLILVLSVLLGGLGIDRFMIGDVGMGMLKLFTFGLCGILWLIDLFTIRDKVDEYNRGKAAEVLATIKSTS